MSEQPQPEHVIQGQQAPAPAPAGPPPAPHTPLIQRVLSLEDRLTELIGRHNTFVDDVLREIGL